jgi:hypothetical protein
MPHPLSALVPLGLAASVSPVMLSEQTVLLSGTHGRRSALAYAAGTVTVAVVAVTAVLVMGRSLDLPTAPHLSAGLDLGLGAALLVGAALVRRGSSRRHERHEVALAPAAAFGFGLLSMATNFTTLALLVPAAKDVSTDRLGLGTTLVAATLLVACACLPAWGPVALATVAPRTADRVLGRLKHQIDQHGRMILVVVLAGAGAYLLLRGAYELSHL